MKQHSKELVSWVCSYLDFYQQCSQLWMILKEQIYDQTALYQLSFIESAKINVKLATFLTICIGVFTFFNYLLIQRSARSKR